MKRLLQRLDDWRRERRIKGIVAEIQAAPDRADKRKLWAAMQVEIHARSPQQVARMERKMGIGP